MKLLSGISVPILILCLVGCDAHDDKTAKNLNIRNEAVEIESFYGHYEGEDNSKDIGGIEEEKKEKVILSDAPINNANEKIEAEHIDFTKDELEEQIEKIRDVYYSFTQNPDGFQDMQLEDKITISLSKESGLVRCLRADYGAFPEIDGEAKYKCEFFYDTGQDGRQSLCFAFIYNKEGTEEYRYYVYKSRIIRYIGPYSAPETTRDYYTPVEPEFVDSQIGQYVRKGLEYSNG